MASSNKQNDVKKAFKGVAKVRNLKSVNSYHKISNNELLEWMIKNRCGTQWISEGSIRIARRSMPNIYREK